MDLRPRRKPIFDDKGRLLDHFGLLLVVTIASIVILSLVNTGPRLSGSEARWESVAASVLVGITLLLALRASGLARRWQRVAEAFVILVIGSLASIALLSSLSDSVPDPSTAAPPIVVLLSVAAPLAVVRRLAQHREVTRGTLLGAISGYLLIPIAFFYMFLAANRLQGDAFFGDPQPTTSFMYFSLTTVSTVGYGDLSAKTDLGRLLATSEALIGQVYLVTFVALLVGLYASARMASRSSSTEPASAQDAQPDESPVEEA